MFDIFSLPEVKMPDGFLWGAGFYRDVIEANGVTPELIQKHLKEIPSLVVR